MRFRADRRQPGSCPEVGGSPGQTGLRTQLGVLNRLIGKWPGGSDEDFDRTPYLTPQSHSERNSSTERTLSCAPSDCDSPPEPLQTSVSSNSVLVPAVMSGTIDITSLAFRTRLRVYTVILNVFFATPDKKASFRRSDLCDRLRFFPCFT